MSPTMPTRSNHDWLWIALPAAAILAVLWFLHGRPFVDDAYITYRYAANWGAGFGPVYNVGEQVEGYSCFLWMALLAAGARLGIQPQILAPVLNLPIVLCCVFLLSRLCFALGLSRPRMTALVVTLLFALSEGTAFYAAAGMETPLFTAALLLYLLALHRGYERGAYGWAIPAALILDLARVEGFLYVVVGAAVAFGLEAMRRENPNGRSAATRLVFVVALLTAAMFAVRYAVYGMWISTTVVSKGYATHLLRDWLGGDPQAIRGLKRVISKGIGYELPALMMGAWIPFVALASGRERPPLLPVLLGLSSALSVGIGVWSGGDWMPHHRFIVAVLPVMLAVIAWTLDRMSVSWSHVPWLKAAAPALTAAVVVVWTLAVGEPFAFARAHEADRSPEFQRTVGEALGRLPGPVTLVTNTAGQIAYHAGPRVRVRDLLGLTDLHNALYGDTWYIRFGRMDREYTFSRPMDVFQTNAWDDIHEFLRFRERHPEVARDYVFLVREDWLRSRFMLAAAAGGEAAKMLAREFGARALPIEAASVVTMKAISDGMPGVPEGGPTGRSSRLTGGHAAETARGSVSIR
jgi:hypothetical protein